MCGIAGFVGDVDRQTLGRMTDLLRHRGPDDGDTWYGPGGGNQPPVGLGHRRLSIIDLSAAGRQPMATRDGRYRMTFNGEIYNYRELRSTLKALGFSFRSESDTEVLLNGFAAWGEGILDRMNGMFAFAVWDSKRNALFVARDRFGIKPLYYTQCGGSFLFASEIKSLLAEPRVARQLDPGSLHKFLSFLWVPGPETMFAGIHKLMPGHCGEWTRSTFSTHCWWDCAAAASHQSDGTLDAHAERVDALLYESVQRRLVADVPLGAFLSGGVDSSAVVAMMSEEKEGLTTYTVGFTAEDLKYEIVDDDIKYARIVAEQFRTDYQEIMLRPQVVEILPRVIWHMDEPVADPAAISAYLICQAAGQKLKVLLNGQGADEVFAGYPRHLAVKYAAYYNRLPRIAREHLIPRLLNPMHAAGTGRMSTVVRNLKKLTRSAKLPFLERYLGYLTHFQADEKFSLYDPALARTLREADSNEAHWGHLARVNSATPVSQMCYLDLKTFLVDLNLTYTDKMSMAHGVEVRVPFLDHTLVEMALGIPDEQKIAGRMTKAVLKRAVGRRLANDVIHRRKAGFTAPIRGWLQGDLRGLVDNWLSPESIRGRGLFQPREVDRLVRDHRSGVEDNAWKIWQLITLELWMRTFIDRDGSSPVAIEEDLLAKRSHREPPKSDRVERSGTQDALPVVTRLQLWRRTPRALKRAIGPVARFLSPGRLYGKRFRKLCEDVRAMDRWTAEQTHVYQVDRIRDICRLASNTPYYGELFDRAGFDWRDVSDVSALSALPLCDRHAIDEHLDEMCVTSPRQRGVERVTTGGTSGEPLAFYIGTDRSYAEYAFLVNSWERAGYTLDKPQVVLRGAVVKPDRRGLRHEYDPLLRRHYYSSFHMNDEGMGRYLEHMRTVGDCYLHVYPSTVLALARYIRRAGAEVPTNILGILVGSENVYADDRKLVEDVFQTRYFSWYGHSEKLVMAAECEHSTDYHVWPTYGYFELVDEFGSPVTTPGVRGEIVGTGFINRVVPFIRYRTGDWATYVGPSCSSCGREHVVIRDIVGHRTQEMLVAIDGALISWTAVNMHDSTFDHVRQFQFRQTEPGKATLRVVSAGRFGNEEMRVLRKNLSRKLAGRLDFEIEVVDRIELSVSGKSTFVDQHLPVLKALESEVAVR